VTCLHQRLLFDLFLFADEEPVSLVCVLAAGEEGPSFESALLYSDQRHSKCDEPFGSHSVYCAGMPRTGKGLASLACIVQGMYPGHMGTYIGYRSGYQSGLWWFSRGLNQRVVEPAKGEGQGVGHGSLGRAIQEWLQYEVVGFLGSCNTCCQCNPSCRYGYC